MSISIRTYIHLYIERPCIESEHSAYAQEWVVLAREGDHFELRGEMLFLPPGQGFSIYSLAAVLPLLAAKQRPSHPNDWMTSDAEVACPDPNCGSRLRITRLGLRRFSHAQTTAVPLPPGPGMGDET